MLDSGSWIKAKTMQRQILDEKGGSWILVKGRDNAKAETRESGKPGDRDTGTVRTKHNFPRNVIPAQAGIQRLFSPQGLLPLRKTEQARRLFYQRNFPYIFQLRAS